VDADPDSQRIMQMVSRDELYRLVWSEPMTKVAERFDVSGSYLARVCTYLNVPRPERGYWAKLAVGKAPRQRELPDPHPGDPLLWSKDGDVIRMPKPAAPVIPKAGAKPVRISRTSVHGLIRGAKAHFENSRTVKEDGYLKPYKQLLVDVTTSKASLDKALDLANDLFNALESVGHRVMLSPSDAQLRRKQVEERESPTKARDYWQHGGLWSPGRPTVVYVGTVAIGLSVIEMSENVTMRYVRGGYIRDSDYVPPRNRYQAEHTWTTQQDVPSGRMRIRAFSPYGAVDWSTHWQETKAAGLRSQIRAIVAEIEAAAPMLVEKLEEEERQAEIRRQQWEIEKEKRRREEDRQRIEQSVADNKADLREVIERWSYIMGIERFLGGVEDAARTLPQAQKEATLERLALARAFLGTQDPLDFFRDWKTPIERYKPLFVESGPT
jgi:L-lactate utilization protein LutC